MPDDLSPVSDDFSFFPMGADETPYRLLTNDYVGVDTFRGEKVLVVERPALELLASEAFKDISHLLRPGHLQQLRNKIGVIFQDFTRYQMTVGENIGAGDVSAFDDRERWQVAARDGMAAPFVERMASGYDTQLGRWFADGQELSLGQWQKMALSRAFMRMDADILILDEPTAAMDAAAEAEMFDHFQQLTRDKITILISHRFSTVRRAGQIIVIAHGNGLVCSLRCLS